MERLNEFRKVELVDWFNKDGCMPKTFEHGVLYVSHKFELAIHLCACGCGVQTVMPISQPKGWKMTTKKIPGTTEADRPYDFTVTFTPSVGNQKFACKSHYFITDNKIQWLSK